MIPPPVHLPAAGPTLRKNGYGQAYRLTEEAPSAIPLDVVAWLGVEKHARWRPIGGTTYCNVYAYDYCTAVGAYLPRVWWSSTARVLWENDREVEPVYAATLFELSANALYRWLADVSHLYGWQRLASLDEAQRRANNGDAVVMCCRRVREQDPGHIACVVPESDRCEARRDAAGHVTHPVQSQAGGVNRELSTVGPWWNGPAMAEWGVWACRTALSFDDVPDTEPQTPKSKSSDRIRAVDAPIVDSGAATPLRAGEGEHTPIRTASEDGEV